jgi:alpha-amylase
LQIADLTGDEATSYLEYMFMGRVTEFRYGVNLANVIRKTDGRKLHTLEDFGHGPSWNQINESKAIVFLSNHVSQREQERGSGVLTFLEPHLYRMATAFELAWPYGHVKIMSSYAWPKIGQVGARIFLRVVTFCSFFPTLFN